MCIRDRYDLYLRTERNLAPGTIINLTVLLKTIVGEAIADGIITANPFMGYEPVRPKHVQKYLTAEELHRIMTCLLYTSEALDKFYAREYTLSLGVCNGCQLMMELGLITPDNEKKGKMLHNDSHKFESTFIEMCIRDRNITMPYG